MTFEATDATLDREVQRLALTGTSALRMRTLLLAVKDAARAREFVGALLDDELLAFGPGGSARGLDAIASIGFTCDGLRALGAPASVLAALRDKSPAFAQGAAVRAARLGDTGESAAERWDPAFESQRAQVWIAIHAGDLATLDAAVDRLRRLDGAQGLAGWERAHGPPDGKQLRDPDDPKATRVHFGFRDSITKPSILDRDRKLPRPGPHGDKVRPCPGELLLGYPNNDGADLWTAGDTPDDVADFLRHGSFGILRQVEQFEHRLAEYLEVQARRLQKDGHVFATEAYLKAKLCGRWPNGAPVLPGEITEPPAPDAQRLATVNFADDPHGHGCPFGAHIRRANPRTDPLLPPRARALFRRGIPYGEVGDKEVGLLGVFFCARIEDQFEHLVSEWLEKNPMGPANRGRAKDPLVGHHDEPDAQFHIPLPGGEVIALDGLTPFVRTRGTLYALFPSRQALKALAAGSAPRAGWIERHSTVERADKRAAAPEQAKATADALDAPSDRFCDIVMEGGITSGVIYASAVVELARHYRFRSIGGSSIGAFAAALAAAAEYRRRHGSGDGFEQLARLPDELAQEEDGRTRLERVFIPQPRTRRLFGIFLATLERGGPVSRILHGVRAALWQYRSLAVAMSLVLAIVVLAGPLLSVQQCWSVMPAVACVLPLLSWILAAVLAVGTGLVLALVAGIGWDVARGLVPNGFGLCRGWDPDAPPDSPDLAAFLHYAIQKVAGRGVRDKPLTFRDLWDAPGAADKALGFEAHGTGARSINLEVYASNLAHGRPYRFPLDEAEDMGRLFFRVDELERYFPRGLVQYLAAVSTPYAARSEADPPTDTVRAGYLELPVADLPIVVAARLAMSFPLLVSAVPLHAVEHGARRMSRCWMSDGGLCSNFPIHLFDSFLPMWPTFGISLESRDENNQVAVRLPTFHTSGRADSWDHGPETGPWKLAGFVGSLWRTTWRWNDSTMMRMPGVRDRVVRLYLADGEGGVNIRMPPERIRLLGTTYGLPAARAFIEKFAAGGWEEHRWVRLNCLLISVRERIRNFGIAAKLDRHATPLAVQIKAALTAAPLGKPARRSRVLPSEAILEPEQADELRALLQALCELESAFEACGDHQPYSAVPRSSLRIRHPT
jgi:deferrochelatase/peroxidase EfeB/predicted acylesterase/phospholipase RssA